MPHLDRDGNSPSPGSFVCRQNGNSPRPGSLDMEFCSLVIGCQARNPVGETRMELMEPGTKSSGAVEAEPGSQKRLEGTSLLSQDTPSRLRGHLHEGSPGSSRMAAACGGLDDTGPEPVPQNHADKLAWPVPGRSRGAGPPQRSRCCWLAPQERQRTVPDPTLHPSIGPWQGPRGQRNSLWRCWPAGTAGTPGPLLCWLTPPPCLGRHQRPKLRATTM